MIDMILISLIWLIMSVFWFLRNVGEKYIKDTWIDYIIYLPLTIILYLIVFIKGE